VQTTLSCLDQSDDPTPAPLENIVPAAGTNSDTVNNSCYLIGSNFTGMWTTRRTFIITAGYFSNGSISFTITNVIQWHMEFATVNTTGLSGFYSSSLASTCSPLPWCAVVAVNAPAPGLFFVTIRTETSVNNFPPQSYPIASKSPSLVGRYLGSIGCIFIRIAAEYSKYSIL
jgi:hypothetical protein